MDNLSRLRRGTNELGLTLSDEKVDQLLLYLALIQKWNKAYNLVGTSDTSELIDKHLLDSLSISPYIHQSPVIDVGSGAGLPGIPLAISLPDISFTLVDANGKKVRFMRQACIELNLTNVEIVQTRIENFTASSDYKTVVSRAFAPLDSALEQLSKVCSDDGKITIMLGTAPQTVPKSEHFQEITIHKIDVPGLHSNRHILVASK